MESYLLVGGWPGAGKTTVSHQLAEALGKPYLGKDVCKEVLMEQFGIPQTVAESRRIGEAATRVVLRLARDCPGAVVDSTWFDYTRALVGLLPGPKVEVRCVASLETVRARYRARQRGRGHLDRLRAERELWAHPVPLLGVGPSVEVDTEGPVVVDELVQRLIEAERRSRDEPSNG